MTYNTLSGLHPTPNSIISFPKFPPIVHLGPSATLLAFPPRTRRTHCHTGASAISVGDDCEGNIHGALFPRFTQATAPTSCHLRGLSDRLS